MLFRMQAQANRAATPAHLRSFDDNSEENAMAVILLHYL